ncbi:hypothetical protein U1Q18_023529 [Sarracenia purpurea var. burkii]
MRVAKRRNIVDDDGGGRELDLVDDEDDETVRVAKVHIWTVARKDLDGGFSNGHWGGKGDNQEERVTVVQI